MGRLLNTTVSGMLVLGLVAMGCGGLSSQSTNQTSAKARPANLEVTSPAFQEGQAIPARYTCDGVDTSPSLRWVNTPKGTAEFVLLIVGQSEHGPSGKEAIVWVATGLRPTLKGIAAGKLPAGAIVGRNSRGRTHYSICPPKGSGVRHYTVIVGALKHHLSLHRGFSINDFNQATGGTVENGALTWFTYKRGR